MSRFLIGADGRTCCKIIAVALAGSIGMLMLSMSLVISIAAWRVESEAPTSLTLVNGPGFEAGKATISATLAHQSFDSRQSAPETPQQHTKETPR